ncbi:TolC family protein [Flavobacterium agrisoli]|uniref:TolC family protein n=1 Tax=Flavobacterium agrisoli TaxID=2793066 RepID=A0A934PNM1_9FLAO|nr:TolC family protein [Flavobacterium agrisoli]MBK0369733.1 TolC family protein [Flavobacterium agrisoli]
MQKPSKHNIQTFSAQFGKTLLVFSVLLAFSCRVKTPPKSEDLQEIAFTNFALPSTWKSAPTDAVINDTTAVAQNWLGDFNDPVLDSLVAEALRYNPDLLIGSSRIEQSEGYVALSKAALRPALNLLGRGGTNMAQDFSMGITGVLLSASWEIDLWGKLRNAKAASIANYDATVESYHAAQLSIAAAVVRNWYNAAEIYQELLLAQEMVKTNNQLADLAKKRFDIGIGNQIDYEIAKANLSSTNDGLQKMQLAYNNQIRALEILIGRYPGAELETTKNLAIIENEIPAGIPLQMLERRPDLKAAQKRFEAAFHKVEEAKANRLPNLKLTANFGELTSSFLNLKSDFENPVSGAGGIASFPIYQGGGIKASIAIRTSEQKQAVYEYSKVVLNAFNDVENALNSTQILLQREKFLSSAVTSSQKAFELEKQLYEVGKTDMRSVSQQQLSLYASKLTLLRVQNEKITQRVNLYLALGGSL